MQPTSPLPLCWSTHPSHQDLELSVCSRYGFRRSLLNTDSFVPAVDPLNVFLLQAHGNKAKTVLGDLMIVLGVGARVVKILMQLPDGNISAVHLIVHYN